MSIITCENLTLAFNSYPVVEDLSFNVEHGDYLCIVGENGSGKTTLMRAILGLIKPVFGKIEFGEGLRRTDIGYLPQQSEHQRDFPATIWEVVLSGTQNLHKWRPFYSRADAELARHNMKLVKIDGMEKRCYHELSGGQQQRVLLARALCAAQKLILLDEPVAGLDPIVTQDMYSIIRSINRENGITVIMVSHDIDAAMRDASKVLHLSHTRAFFGTVEEYRNSDVARRFVTDI